MKRKTVLLITLALLVAALPIFAAPQVTARQGEASAPKIVQFESPMILDLPLPNILGLKPGSAKRLAEVRNYICDKDASLLSLTVAKQYKGPKKARTLELIVAGLVSIIDSFDRRVDIRLRLKDGDVEIGAGILRNYSTAEERNTEFSVSVPVNEAKLQAAYDSEHGPVLEPTLTVRDDS
ncbi:MAG TPA: hypothetical protein VN851_25165 [Thermoanaerobaculia bacterium]|nr:hypothetical protein [Thermoanaerobaculia bacterium]